MKCPNCNTENGYPRFETKEWVCRKCGKISPFKIIEKLNQETPNKQPQQKEETTPGPKEVKEE